MWGLKFDHSPLLVVFKKDEVYIIKPFKFLNFWVKHDTFLDCERANWSADGVGDPFVMFNKKLKNIPME